jgi:hypothetical protein
MVPWCWSTDGKEGLKEDKKIASSLKKTLLMNSLASSLLLFHPGSTAVSCDTVDPDINRDTGCPPLMAH